MSEKEVVYRFDMPGALKHFKSDPSYWYAPSAEVRRVITGAAHDDYVDTKGLNEPVHGSVPRSILVATDEDADDIRAAYQAAKAT